MPFLLVSLSQHRLSESGESDFSSYSFVANIKAVDMHPVELGS